MSKLKELFEQFLSDPEKLRRNAALVYHPDRLPEELKPKGEEVMKRINAVCDELERKRAAA